MPEGRSGLLGETRIVGELPIACPAGAPVHETIAGAACRCRITQSTIASATDPSSLAMFCLSEQGHKLCPAWRDDKERAWAQRRPVGHGLPGRA